MALAKTVPHPGGAESRGWTYGDLFKLPNDGKRYEIIDGELYEMPAPNLIHQFILARLFEILLAAAKAGGGQALPSPLDVFMPGLDPVEPDLIVLMPDRFHLASVRGIEGPPNLLVEILSPSNPRHDRVRKRMLYARGGVPEYWIVSPESATIEVLVLAGDEYRTHCFARDDDTVTSTVLPGVSVAASTIFEPAAFLQE